MIDVSKKNLIILSSLAIIIILSLGFVYVFFPRYEISISSIDPKDMGIVEQLEDFEYLYKFVQENYPYLRLKERTHGYNWLDLKEIFEQRIRNVTNNKEFLSIIMEAVEALQNRHTYVVNPETVIKYHNQFGDITPMNLIFSDKAVEANNYWSKIFDDIYDQKYFTRFDVRIVYDRGDYIITDYYARPLVGIGTKVTKINGVPIDDAVKNCYNKEYLDWDVARNKTYLWSISPHDFGYNAEFTVLDSRAEEKEVIFNIANGSSSIYSLYPSTKLNFKIFEEKSIGYMYVGTFDLSTIEPRFNEILDFFREIENFEYLVIDIRGNTGGHFESWVEGIVRPLIKEDRLHEYYLAYRKSEYVKQFHDEYLREKDPIPKEMFVDLPTEVYSDDYTIYNFSTTYTSMHQVDFDGEIILLTDFMVYSAAEGFTNFCKQSGFATIYGTPSGGDGFFIWPLYCILPNSKIVITMTSSMSLDCMGRANEEVRTLPDVYHESLFMDHDNLLNFVFADISKG